ncbi:hypothetical protein A3Q56_01466 [Intoshia linei]|uniref:DNA helicase n=2 Tax=Protostomia TaxID=33317 RepID=A0A177B8Z9_9BILA|nr:hypothetical protein A3Q56_01466 [Intoshia linei]
MSGYDTGAIYSSENFGIGINKSNQKSYSRTNLLSRFKKFLKEYRDVNGLFIYRKNFNIGFKKWFSSESKLLSSNGHYFRLEFSPVELDPVLTRRGNRIDELKRNFNLGKKWVKVNMEQLSLFDNELSEHLKNSPSDTIELFEEAIKCTVDDVTRPRENGVEIGDFQIMLGSNESCIGLRDLKSDLMSKINNITGIVTSVSNIRSKASSMSIQCRGCQQVISNIQVDRGYDGYMLPKKCTNAGPTRKGDAATCPVDPYFILPNKCKSYNQQTIRLQETTDSIPCGEIPRAIQVYCDRSLCELVVPGNRVNIVGIYCIKKQNFLKSKGSEPENASTRKPYVRMLGVDFTDNIDGGGNDKCLNSIFSYTAADEEEFKKMAATPNIYDIIAKSIAPSIWGSDNVKKAIACVLFSGSRKRLYDGLTRRGDINLLMLGDPGTAKSQLLKFVERCSPIGVYTSGKGSSAAGLTASVIKDPVTKGYVMEGGAMVLADGGVVCIDEFDKMREDDRVAIHEAMEQQTISIAKAGITTTLNSRCAVLAAANSALGKWDDSRMDQNIDLMPTLLSRFDMIFIMKDKYNVNRDQEMARHVIDVHMMNTEISEEVKAEISMDKLRRYIAYCRQQCAPRLTNKAAAVLRDQYVKMRNGIQEIENETGKAPVIPITVRQLEAIVRISEAIAKMRLSSFANENDIKEALRLFKESTLHAASVGSLSGAPEFTSLAEQGVLRTIESQLKKRFLVGSTVPQHVIIQDFVRQKYSEDQVCKVLHFMLRRGEMQFRLNRKMLYRAHKFEGFKNGSLVYDWNELCTGDYLILDFLLSQNYLNTFSSPYLYIKQNNYEYNESEKMFLFYIGNESKFLYASLERNGIKLFGITDCFVSIANFENWKTLIIEFQPYKIKISLQNLQSIKAVSNTHGSHVQVCNLSNSLSEFNKAFLSFGSLLSNQILFGNSIAYTPFSGQIVNVRLRKCGQCHVVIPAIVFISNFIQQDKCGQNLNSKSISICKGDQFCHLNVLNQEISCIHKYQDCKDGMQLGKIYMKPENFIGTKIFHFSKSSKFELVGNIVFHSGDIKTEKFLWIKNKNDYIDMGSDIVANIVKNLKMQNYINDEKTHQNSYNTNSQVKSILQPDFNLVFKSFTFTIRLSVFGSTLNYGIFCSSYLNVWYNEKKTQVTAQLFIDYEFTKFIQISYSGYYQNYIYDLNIKLSIVNQKPTLVMYINNMAVQKNDIVQNWNKQNQNNPNDHNNVHYDNYKTHENQKEKFLRIGNCPHFTGFAELLVGPCKIEWKMNQFNQLNRKGHVQEKSIIINNKKFYRFDSNNFVFKFLNMPKSIDLTFSIKQNNLNVPYGIIKLNSVAIFQQNSHLYIIYKNDKICSSNVKGTNKISIQFLSYYEIIFNLNSIKCNTLKVSLPIYDYSIQIGDSSTYYLKENTQLHLISFSINLSKGESIDAIKNNVLTEVNVSDGIYGKIWKSQTPVTNVKSQNIHQNVNINNIIKRVNQEGVLNFDGSSTMSVTLKETSFPIIMSVVLYQETSHICTVNFENVKIHVDMLMGYLNFYSSSNVAYINEKMRLGNVYNIEIFYSSNIMTINLKTKHGISKSETLHLRNQNNKKRNVINPNVNIGYNDKDGCKFFFGCLMLLNVPDKTENTKALFNGLYETKNSKICRKISHENICNDQRFSNSQKGYIMHCMNGSKCVSLKYGFYQCKCFTNFFGNKCEIQTHTTLITDKYIFVNVDNRFNAGNDEKKIKNLLIHPIQFCVKIDNNHFFNLFDSHKKIVQFLFINGQLIVDFNNEYKHVKIDKNYFFIVKICQINNKIIVSVDKEIIEFILKSKYEMVPYTSLIFGDLDDSSIDPFILNIVYLYIGKFEIYNFKKYIISYNEYKEIFNTDEKSLSKSLQNVNLNHPFSFIMVNSVDYKNIKLNYNGIAISISFQTPRKIENYVFYIFCDKNSKQKNYNEKDPIQIWISSKEISIIRKRNNLNRNRHIKKRNTNLNKNYISYSTNISNTIYSIKNENDNKKIYENHDKSKNIIMHRNKKDLQRIQNKDEIALKLYSNGSLTIEIYKEFYTFNLQLEIDQFWSIKFGYSMYKNFWNIPINYKNYIFNQPACFNNFKANHYIIHQNVINERCDSYCSNNCNLGYCSNQKCICSYSAHDGENCDKDLPGFLFGSNKNPPGIVSYNIPSSFSIVFAFIAHDVTLGTIVTLHNNLQKNLHISIFLKKGWLCLFNNVKKSIFCPKDAKNILEINKQYTVQFHHYNLILYDQLFKKLYSIYVDDLYENFIFNRVYVGTHRFDNNSNFNHYYGIVSGIFIDGNVGIYQLLMGGVSYVTPPYLIKNEYSNWCCIFCLPGWCICTGDKYNRNKAISLQTQTEKDKTCGTNTESIFLIKSDEINEIQKDSKSCINKSNNDDIIHSNLLERKLEKNESKSKQKMSFYKDGKLKTETDESQCLKKDLNENYVTHSKVKYKNKEEQNIRIDENNYSNHKLVYSSKININCNVPNICPVSLTSVPFKNENKSNKEEEIIYDFRYECKNSPSKLSFSDSETSNSLYGMDDGLDYTLNQRNMDNSYSGITTRKKNSYFTNINPKSNVSRRQANFYTISRQKSKSNISKFAAKRESHSYIRSCSQPRESRQSFSQRRKMMRNVARNTFNQNNVNFKKYQTFDIDQQIDDHVNNIKFSCYVLSEKRNIVICSSHNGPTTLWNLLDGKYYIADDSNITFDKQLIFLYNDLLICGLKFNAEFNSHVLSIYEIENFKNIAFDFYPMFADCIDTKENSIVSVEFNQTTKSQYFIVLFIYKVDALLNLQKIKNFTINIHFNNYYNLDQMKQSCRVDFVKHLDSVILKYSQIDECETVYIIDLLNENILNVLKIDCCRNLSSCIQFPFMHKSFLLCFNSNLQIVNYLITSTKCCQLFNRPLTEVTESARDSKGIVLSTICHNYSHQLVLIATKGGIISIYKIVNDGIKFIYLFDSKIEVNSACISHDATFCVTIHNHNQIYLWYLPKGILILKQTTSLHVISAILSANDETLIIVGRKNGNFQSVHDDGLQIILYRIGKH